ncbi:A24 family peptidase [Escherichia coli]|uniref:A24 family peptidase n=1 Tax=Escherichia coli TaxID=562 RepID=UPI0018109F2D|nr:prepilin peptidase [Escherichia coli]EFM6915947.1 prepilin peptidase [Escherichia coli]EIA5476427.1 prepilin peptidase [Escherichia coli]EIR8508914.1 prepilin peptidase [Escherichia coli]EKB2746822.1 prepilin peptidase [Escherichia coli]
MSALLSMAIIIIILAVILYLAYSTAAIYLSAVHDTRPPKPVVYMCCLLAIVSVSLNGAYGVEATGLLFLSILTGLLTVMTLTDIAVCRLPRILTLSLIILGAAFRYSQDSLTHALLNASLWFGMIYLLRRIFLAAKGTEALGLGDVFLIAGIAMWTQPQHTPLIITAAASGAFLFILIFCRRRRQQALPFAPFLCASLYALTLFPDSVFRTSEIFT